MECRFYPLLSKIEIFCAFFVRCIPIPSNTFILSSIAKNCVELYKSGRRVNNVYTIDSDGSGAFHEYCGQAIAGGG